MTPADVHIAAAKELLEEAAKIAEFGKASYHAQERDDAYLRAGYCTAAAQAHASLAVAEALLAADDKPIPYTVTVP